MLQINIWKHMYLYKHIHKSPYRKNTTIIKIQIIKYKICYNMLLLYIYIYIYKFHKEETIGIYKITEYTKQM